MNFTESIPGELFEKLYILFLRWECFEHEWVLRICVENDLPCEWVAAMWMNIQDALYPFAKSYDYAQVIAMCIIVKKQIENLNEIMKCLI